MGADLVAGCAVYGRYELDERYGPADPARYDRVPVSDPSIDFRRDVKPVLDNRCVVCHGCYDAPCQLQSTSYEGVTRGANKDPVYDSARLMAAEPSRLFIDAHSNAEWRKMDFYPVLNERDPTPQANREGSVLYRMLAMKQNHPWPDSGLLPREDFDLSRPGRNIARGSRNSTASSANIQSGGCPTASRRSPRASMRPWCVGWKPAHHTAHPNP